MVKLAVAALVACFAVALGEPPARADGSAQPSAVASIDRQAALRELAAVAVRRTVTQLGHPGGFYRTQAFHIGLPKSLDKAVDALAANYAPSLATALEKAINHTAENVTTPAGDFVLAALPSVRFADPEQILQGPVDATTVALRREIGPAFRDALRPLIRTSLAVADAPAALQRMRARYEQITNAAFPDFDLEGYALDSFTAAFFTGIAQEEQNIRLRPSARSTEMLQQLFSKN